MSEIRLVYITAKDKAEALALGRSLVEARLAACANVLEGMTSVYRWQGKLEEASEVVLIAKTESRLVRELVAAVQKEHSYDIPCALVLPVVEGAGPYMNWLSGELRP
jgi:periplasmic divalent cation tolerance protein